MRSDAVALEEERLNSSDEMVKPLLHERHRAFPAAFEDRGHRKILDVAAGMGYTVRSLQKDYDGNVYCNDLSPTSLMSLKQIGFPVMRFSLDNDQAGFPLQSGSFDAVIALATIEHILQVDVFVQEVHRILSKEGCFYVSAPNYAGLSYLLPLIMNGKTFHDPMDPSTKYEFYAHVRYFTYHTLFNYIRQFGFVPETVYLPTPRGSSNYVSLNSRSRVVALGYRLFMNLLYRLSPRWSAEPILCFRKTDRKEIQFRRKLI